MGGRAARPVGPAGEAGNIWDHYAVEYEYKNGVRMYSYCRHIPGDNDVSEAVVGTKGRASLQDGAWSINRKPIEGAEISPYVQEHIDLLNSIRAGKPINELKNVTDSTFTAILGRNASYACKTLKWEDALAANEDTMPKNLSLDAACRSSRPRLRARGSCRRGPKEEFQVPSSRFQVENRMPGAVRAAPGLFFDLELGTWNLEPIKAPAPCPSAPRSS